MPLRLIVAKNCIALLFRILKFGQLRIIKIVFISLVLFLSRRKVWRPLWFTLVFTTYYLRCSAILLAFTFCYRLFNWACQAASMLQIWCYDWRLQWCQNFLNCISVWVFTWIYPDFRRWINAIGSFWWGHHTSSICCFLFLKHHHERRFSFHHLKFLLVFEQVLHLGRVRFSNPLQDLHPFSFGFFRLFPLQLLTFDLIYFLLHQIVVKFDFLRIKTEGHLVVYASKNAQFRTKHCWGVTIARRYANFTRNLHLGIFEGIKTQNP